MLREPRVSLLVDIRSFPLSRANPALNIDRLPVELKKVQIGSRLRPLSVKTSRKRERRAPPWRSQARFSGCPSRRLRLGRRIAGRHGTAYFKEIEAFPHLSDGRLAAVVARERCARSPAAFP